MLSACGGAAAIISFSILCKRHQRTNRVGLICIISVFLISVKKKTPSDASLLNPDGERVPDKLWPNAAEIVCSAVSRCSRYIALGLADGLVCVCDRRLGEQTRPVFLG